MFASTCIDELQELFVKDQSVVLVSILSNQRGYCRNPNEATEHPDLRANDENSRSQQNEVNQLKQGQASLVAPLEKLPIREPAVRDRSRTQEASP